MAPTARRLLVLELKGRRYAEMNDVPCFWFFLGHHGGGGTAQALKKGLPS